MSLCLFVGLVCSQLLVWPLAGLWPVTGLWPLAGLWPVTGLWPVAGLPGWLLSEDLRLSARKFTLPAKGNHFPG